MATSRSPEEVMVMDTEKDCFSVVTEELKACQSDLQKREKLIDMGFEYFDDGDEDEKSEILAERAARPETDRQRQLITFFEGDNKPSGEIMRQFLAERESDEVNYALFRRYFRNGNNQLKKLILYGLANDPANEALLNDLVFFNEFKPDLKELVRFFKLACRASNDKVQFKELAGDFYGATQSYGYDAFHELLQDESISKEKQEIVKELNSFYDHLENSMRF